MFNPWILPSSDMLKPTVLARMRLAKAHSWASRAAPASVSMKGLTVPFSKTSWMPCKESLNLRLTLLTRSLSAPCRFMSSSVGQQKDSPSAASLPTVAIRSSLGSYRAAIFDGLKGTGVAATEVGGDGALELSVMGLVAALLASLALQD